MLERLEDEHAGPLADDQAAPADVEGTACPIGIVVARREHPHDVPAGHRDGCQRRVGAAAQDQIEMAAAQR